jgi:predicted dehydrogenase
MNHSTKQGSSRRDFLGATSLAAASTTLAAIAPAVYAADSETIQVALVGAGGRGTGAAQNALNVKGQPVKLVAMADVFEHRLNGSLDSLKKRNPAAKVDVPKDRQFIGFDGYQKAIDCLKPGDVAIFTTPPAFRWVHFDYAIKKGVNVFMEKPLTADGPTSRRMLDLGKQASAKGLKVGVGLMSRHQRALQEAQKRIADGEIGDIITMRGYRMTGPVASFRSEKWPGNPSELLWQISRFHSFLWASGGAFNDYYIHIVDHLCWMKGAWPVKAQAAGGRHYRGNWVDQNFDSYAVEYTFADGTKLFFDGRCMDGAQTIYSSHAHGTKGSAVLSSGGDCGLPSRFYKSQAAQGDGHFWQSEVPGDQRDPYQNEWNDLIDAIRNDKPYNETEYGVMASLTGTLGRIAAHTAREWTMDQVLKSNHEYAPGIDKWTMDSPPPIKCDKDGRYPVPEPGVVVDREYGERTV